MSAVYRRLPGNHELREPRRAHETFRSRSAAARGNIPYVSELSTGFVRGFLSEFKCYRRWCGGKWEQWWLDVIHSAIWFDVEEWTYITGKRPHGLCRGTPTMEDHGPLRHKANT